MRAIRFFLPFQPRAFTEDKKPIPNMSDVSRAYLTRIHEAGLPVRAIPMQGMAYGELSTPAWDSLAHLFTNDLLEQKNFINVVCGFGAECGDKFTPGIVNIAFTTSWIRYPNTQDILSLEKFNVIAVPKPEDVAALDKCGISVTLVPIDKISVSAFLLPFLQD